ILFLFSDGNPNGSTAHCPSSSWPDYSSSYASYSPQTNYYDPHQDSTHGTPIHLPTVLPDSSSGEYISTSLTSPAPMFNSAKADLDPMATTRYTDTAAYCPNNWTANATYPNNNYYNPPVQPAANQIHFHLHATANEKNDHYLGDGVGVTPPQRVEVAQTATSEVAHAHVDPLSIEESDRGQSQNDPSSVWRPY
ncbi:hypothetical protein NQ317_004392, partial [Molorchus minor]